MGKIFLKKNKAEGLTLPILRHKETINQDHVVLVTQYTHRSMNEIENLEINPHV